MLNEIAKRLCHMSQIDKLAEKQTFLNPVHYY